MKKKLLALLLVMAMCFSLGTAALAEEEKPTVTLSAQSLCLNGSPVNCEKYNIDGYNYFKLRDLAYLLNGTGSQFSVEWNAAENLVQLIPGMPYTPVGGELENTGDHSETAVSSTQKFLLFAGEVSGLSVYYINGNNYFKLRELGDLLGFDVDYDEETASMLVNSRKAAFWAPIQMRAVYRTVEGTETVEETSLVLGPARNVAEEHSKGTDAYSLTLTYDGRGNLASRTRTSGDVWSKYSVTMNENRKPITETYEQSDGTRQKISYTYDPDYRVLLRTAEGSGDIQEKTLYTYDAAGNPVGMAVQNNKGFSSSVRTFDQSGRLTTLYYSDEEGYTGSEKYTYDENGNQTHSEVSAGGSVTARSCTYDEAGRILSDVRETSDNRVADTYQYDAKGNVTLHRTETGESWEQEAISYDSKGRLAKKTNSFSDGKEIAYSWQYTCDDNGVILAEKSYQDDAIAYTRDYSYDENGYVTKVSTEYYLNGKLSHFMELSYVYAPIPDETMLRDFERTLGYTEYAQGAYAQRDAAFLAMNP